MNNTLPITVIIATIPGREDKLDRALMSCGNVADSIIVELDSEYTGAAQTRNRALEKVKTSWFAVLDDDDEFYPFHLQECYSHAMKTGADIVYPWFDVVGPSGVVENWRDPCWIKGPDGAHPTGRMHADYRKGRQSPYGHEFDAAQHRDHPFIPVTSLYRTGLVKALGGWPDPRDLSAWPEWLAKHWPQDGSGTNEDYALYRLLQESGAIFSHLPMRTWRWNIDGGNTSGKPENARRLKRQRL